MHGHSWQIQMHCSHSSVDLPCTHPLAATDTHSFYMVQAYMLAHLITLNHRNINPGSTHAHTHACAHTCPRTLSVRGSRPRGLLSPMSDPSSPLFTCAAPAADRVQRTVTQFEAAAALMIYYPPQGVIAFLLSRLQGSISVTALP